MLNGSKCVAFPPIILQLRRRALGGENARRFRRRRSRGLDARIFPNDLRSRWSFPDSKMRKARQNKCWHDTTCCIVSIESSPLPKPLEYAMQNSPTSGFLRRGFPSSARLSCRDPIYPRPYQEGYQGFGTDASDAYAFYVREMVAPACRWCSVFCVGSLYGISGPRGSFLRAGLVPDPDEHHGAAEVLPRVHTKIKHDTSESHS